MVLGFPDTYEIGISNQALQILYHLARETGGVEVERTYLPWVDAIAAMTPGGRASADARDVELLSPSADLLGVTLQHEFNYTNRPRDARSCRTSRFWRAIGARESPLVVAGGPACANFLPVARFLDAVAVGDGEELFPEMLAALAPGQARRRRRAETKRALGLGGVCSSRDRAKG